MSESRALGSSDEESCHGRPRFVKILLYRDKLHKKNSTRIKNRPKWK